MPKNCRERIEAATLGLTEATTQMKDIAEQEVIDLDDMDVETFNEFATEQGWSDGMPLFVPTESKVAKFVETVRGDNRPYPPVPPRADRADDPGPRRQCRDGGLQA